MSLSSANGNLRALTNSAWEKGLSALIPRMTAFLFSSSPAT
jgi:hypothetical protein